ncbi:MAG TPA: DUF5916 domain-containing protein [Vicinamibacterales bacterium]|nr:DUF5916 domain-containing protein [Vicinamibacterales bacterium]
MKLAAALLLALICVPRLVTAQGSEYRVPRAPEPPRLDGILDDRAWAEAPMPTGQWVSYNPNRGDKMPDAYRTEVRVAYDDRNIYFAFHCFDNEPDKIRSNVSKRDSSFNDDWIAISLDSAGTGQAAYHLFSNASASQMDALNTSASGEQFDADMVWFSAARRTSDGYIVELRIPLQTLRFKGGDNVGMNLVMFRKVSRIGYSYAWPELLPGQWVFDSPSRLVFGNLQPRRLVEILPSVTYGINQQRESPRAWRDADDKYNFGASAKLGITSGITLDGTVNPDFSQVESDAFQVQVNQRFPVFFSEKRPFFMEGMGLFNIAGTGGDGNMRTAVHTRRIVDPIYGSKLTGTLGNTAFGVLNAVDDSPTPPFTIEGDPFDVANKVTTVARVSHALQRSDYVGGIFTHTAHEGRRNFVAGGDLSLRPSAAHSLSATFLTTRTTRHDAAALAGNSAQGTYTFATRRWFSTNQVEHYDRDFAMDTAFYNRTGFTGAWTFSEVSFYPKSSWLQRVHPFVFAMYARDRIQRGDEDFVHSGLRLNVTRQGFLNFSHGRGHETFQGVKYRTGSDFNFFGNIQLLRWLSLHGNYGGGPAIYYDETEPFQGRSRRFSVSATVQPNQHLSQNTEFNRTRFWRPETGVNVYTVNIVNSRTTYQFNTHFLVRMLARYDSSQNRVLTDILASYEFVPGTVFHAGYGSLYEKDFGSVEPVPGGAPPLDPREKYLVVNRGLFLKASYLRRF